MRLAAALSLLCLLGCNRPCVREDALTGFDGGAVACVQSLDCPRPSSVLLCASEEDRAFDCVGCTENRCVRYRPEACP